MISISCADAGVKNCPFVATDESKDGAMNKLKEHIAEAHPDEQVSDNRINQAAKNV